MSPHTKTNKAARMGGFSIGGTMLNTLAFWKAAAERAIKTIAQTGVALITANATGLLDVDWVQLGSIAGLAGLVSLLTSIGSDAVTGGTGPSLANEVPKSDA